MRLEIDDPLAPLSVAAGALLVLIGLATLVGTPWAYSENPLGIGIVQGLGALGIVAIGAGLLWIARDLN